MKQANLTDVLKGNYLPYSKYTILSRAIPNIQDGCKISQRRLLFSMYKDKIYEMMKSHTVVGKLMSIHPHSDGSGYDTAVMMVQKDSNILPLIQGKGTFATHTSSDLMPSKPRYTEISLNRELSKYLFDGLDKDCVDFVPTYNPKLYEPTFLPIVFPNVLVNATSGIAVGFASCVPSFNFNEVCNATIEYINDNNVDLTKHMMLDFPTGGKLLYDETQISRIFNEGKGSVSVRAKYHLEDDNIISIDEIPFTTTYEKIIAKIVELCKSGVISEVSNVINDTSSDGTTMAIIVKRGVDRDALMLKLYTLTPLQDVFSANLNVIADGFPVVLGVREVLKKWLEFRRTCIIRSLKYDIDIKEKDLFKKNTVKKIVDIIDKVIEIVRFSNDEEEMIKKLMMLNLTFTREECEYIIDIPLKKLNQKWIMSEIEAIDRVRSEIDKIYLTINNETMIDNIIKNQLKEVSNKFSVPRKTEILYEYENAIRENIIEEVNLKVFTTKDGYVKIVPLTSIKSVSTHKLKDGDFIVNEFDVKSTDDIMFFTSNGVYKRPLHKMPTHRLSDYGLYPPSEFGVDKVYEVVATSDYRNGKIVFGYNDGKVAKIDLSSYISKSKINNGMQMCSSHADLIMCRFINENSNTKIVCQTEEGKVLITDISSISSNQTKTSQGIKTIRMNDYDNVKIMDLSDFVELNCEEKKYLGSLGSQGKFLKNNENISKK